MESLEGKTSGTPSPGSVLTKLKRIAEVACADAWRTHDPRSRMRESCTSGSVWGPGRATSQVDPTLPGFGYHRTMIPTAWRPGQGPFPASRPYLRLQHLPELRARNALHGSRLIELSGQSEPSSGP